jgi:hypothetical protein
MNGYDGDGVGVVTGTVLSVSITGQIVVYREIVSVVVIPWCTYVVLLQTVEVVHFVTNMGDGEEGV